MKILQSNRAMKIKFLIYSIITAAVAIITLIIDFWAK